MSFTAAPLQVPAPGESNRDFEERLHITAENDVLKAQLAAMMLEMSKDLAENDLLRTDNGVVIRWQTFLVDNSELKVPTPGVAFRFSMSMDDRDRDELAPWGSKLFGILAGPDWVKVGRRFLPVKIGGTRVLREVADDDVLMARFAALQEDDDGSGGPQASAPGSRKQKREDAEASSQNKILKKVKEEEEEEEESNNTIEERLREELALVQVEKDMLQRHLDELLGRARPQELRRLRLIGLHRELRAGLEVINEEISRRMLEPNVQKGTWQWQIHDGTFQDFDFRAQAEIDEHLAHFPEGYAEPLEVSSEGRRVRIDFGAMQQQVVGGSGSRRPIRWADALRLQEPTWTAQRLTAELALVDPGTADHAKALNVVFGRSNGSLFQAYMPVSVLRVQNQFLIKKYDAERQNLVAQRGAQSLAEMTLFHGTRAHDPHAIVLKREGFMVDRASEGLYGNGLYFAERPTYSHRYAHYVVQVDGTRHYTILVCRVLCGRIRSMGMATDRHLTRLLLPPEDFDSVEGGPHVPRNGTPADASVMHVVYQDAQVYPEFLVTYRARRPGESEPQVSSEAA